MQAVHATAVVEIQGEAIMKIAKILLLAALAGLTLTATADAKAPQPGPVHAYLSPAGRADVWSGGEQFITISTPDGPHKVWVKRVGNAPRLKVLLLHGGPAAGSGYFAAMDSYLPAAGIEYYYYDQLGAGKSDRPDNDALWTLARYVEELDQVRRGIGADGSNLCLLGHSWGGMLAIEYALTHPRDVKCLVISNMMASIPAYNAYADRVLKPHMDPGKLSRIEELERTGKTDNPDYMGTLIPAFYEEHILRRPYAEWPAPVVATFAQLNTHVYALMQGPSELGASGRLEHWDRSADLKRITVPTLVISGRYDTMDPAYMARMAKALPKGELLATQGGHMALYDDQKAYFGGLVPFLKRQQGR